MTLPEAAPYHTPVSDPSVEQLEEPGFDRALKRLRDLIEQLEAGNLSLEDSLKMYEEGVALARRGHRVLDDAEKRVELLVRDGKDGTMTAIPLDEHEAADGGRQEAD